MDVAPHDPMDRLSNLTDGPLEPTDQTSETWLPIHAGDKADR